MNRFKRKKKHRFVEIMKGKKIMSLLSTFFSFVLFRPSFCFPLTAQYFTKNFDFGSNDAETNKTKMAEKKTSSAHINNKKINKWWVVCMLKIALLNMYNVSNVLYDDLSILWMFCWMSLFHLGIESFRRFGNKKSIRNITHHRYQHINTCQGDRGKWKKNTNSQELVDRQH